MTVNCLSHVNIHTADLTTTVRFYQELLDLKVQAVPGNISADRAMWLCDHTGQAIIHLVKTEGQLPAPRPLFKTGSSGRFTASLTGAIDHVALHCSNKTDILSRLEKSKSEFATHELEAQNVSLVFTRDPNGVLLELNFSNL